MLPVLYLYFLWAVLATIAITFASVPVVYTNSPEKVLAVLDGAPGSGKTTLCGFVGRVVNIKEKDLDYFTQPIANPDHPTVRTLEGWTRRVKWMATSPKNEFTAVKFIHAEIRNFITTVPDTVSIVFCGLSTWNGVDLLPPELSLVPRYVFDVGKEETLKRATIRYLAYSLNAIPDCETFTRMYIQYKNTLNASGMYDAANIGVLRTGDGAVIIRAILRQRANQTVIDRLVSEYEAQPTSDERLTTLARKFGEGCVTSLKGMQLIR